MLGHNFYYHQIIRNLVIAFGNIFNELTIVRYDNNRNEIERILVPLTYMPKESYWARLKQEETIDKDAAITLPRITFSYKNITYDAARHMRSKNVICKNATTDTRLSTFAPVPYNLDFEVAMFVKYQEDGLQLVEQILPFFKPEYSLEINVVPELGLSDDMPVIINGVTVEDDYENDFVTRRSIIWTLDFTVKANFYGPVKEQGLIKTSQADILTTDAPEITNEVIAETPRVARITVQPDPLTALPTDDFGFTETYEEFNDGKKYNPVTGQDEEI